ncbi:hypothetical protein RAA17_12200 [Komagataeibacter rhaeticus]|nr:hypothetical protein [Komagataeibacter rhaeticus]
MVEVTGTDAQVGYLVDHMGNVTPRDNRKGQIPEGQSAYMEGPPVPAPMSGPLAIAVASTGVTPSTDPDHPANWPQNRAKQKEAATDGNVDHPAA